MVTRTFKKMDIRVLGRVPYGKVNTVRRTFTQQPFLRIDIADYIPKFGTTSVKHLVNRLKNIKSVLSNQILVIRNIFKFF